MENKKNYVATLLLAWFLGGFGIHRFYTGHVAIGVVQLLTAGGCGIWTLVDFIMLCFGNYKDANGQELEGYNKTTGLIVFFIWLAISVLAIVLYVLTVGVMFANGFGE